MLRNRSDQLGKNILRDLLALGGDPRTEEEVPPGDAQRIDVWFVPDEARKHVLVAMKGIIAKIAETAAMIELWSHPLRVRAFHKCMRKLYDWHHALELRDKRKWPLPTLWHLCVTHPEALFKEFSFEPVPGQPLGTYRLTDKGFPVYVVVISELPRTRETLLLRLLGSPADRLLAAIDLQDLGLDEVEHRVAYEWLIRLHSELKKVDPATLVKEEEEFVMGAWLEERDRKLIDSAVEKARREFVMGEWLEERDRTLVEKTRFEANCGFVHHVCEKRLGRPLTSEEQTLVAKKLRAEGFERLSDLLLDMSRADVVQWLGSKE